MSRLVPAAALALSLVALPACPERREFPVPPSRKPPQAALAPAPARGTPDALSLPGPEGPQWFGLYMLGKKVGWNRQERRLETRRGQPVVVMRDDAEIQANVGGKVVERRVWDERVYAAHALGPLLEVSAEFSGDGGLRKVSGTCAATVCKVSLTSEASGTTTRTYEGVSETLELAEGPRLAAARRTTLRGGRFSTEHMRVNATEFAFQRRESILAGGAETPVSVVFMTDDTMDRIPTEIRVTDDGRVVGLRFGPNFEARPESERDARRLDTIALFEGARVALPRALPHDVPATIVYRVTGLPATFQVNDGRQRYEPLAGGEVRLSVEARIPKAADPARDTPIARAAEGVSAVDLEPDFRADSDHPDIQRLAREVAGDAKTVYAATLRLSDHVFRLLDTTYGASQDRASDVLRSRRGDCTEHAVLLQALARALGIPARGVHGVVYAHYSDGVDALYWHAWVEVRSAGEWIAVDPTFGQAVADATHVTLGRGFKQDAVGLLGGLQVKSVEVNVPGLHPAERKEKNP